jgi:hypothetical protein
MKKPSPITCGILKLPEQDVKKYLEAIHHYDFERVAHFMRQCAYILIEHHKRGDTLSLPLRFEQSETKHLVSTSRATWI